ncbi:serine hydrolase domain-containing protein [Arthrobacter sp. AQ5-05]|uniref:serine hydrolase domain-containing protein n=1 Tax=Arthrobacter sp. AQ5-05 TaxID=2184581 RepID=UPI0015EB7400|nr:serine hydrolase domain-containing protein [Arthrobacter sp. AQ5-05]
MIERNEHFKCSNIGYGLLGLLVEAAGGLPFADFVDARILAPLQLRDTGADLDERAGELATGYGTLALAGDHGALTGRTRIEHIHTRSPGAATGFHSTTSDMPRYFSSHLVGPGTGVPDDDSKRLMQREAEDSGAPGRGYGLGLIIQDVAGHGSFGRSGGYPGHITRTWAVPKTKVVLSVPTNAIDGPATEYGERLFALAALAGKPTPDSCAGVDEEVLLRFTGRFASLWGVVDIAALGGKLYRINPAAPVAVETTVPLEFVDEATLRSLDPNGFSGYGEVIRFEVDVAGALTMRGPGGMLFERPTGFHAPAVLRVPAGCEPGMEPGAVSRSGNNAGANRHSSRVDGAVGDHQHLGYDPC